MNLWGNSENRGVNTEELYVPVPLRREEVVPLPRETKPFWICDNNSTKIGIELQSHVRNPLQRGVTYMTVGHLHTVPQNREW